MNWQINRITVFFTLALFTLFSCEDSVDVGLDSVGNDIKIGTYYTDTISVQGSTILAKDSILAFQWGNLLAGKFTNTLYGTTSSRPFFQLAINSTSFETGASIDSMVLVLDYNEYYGDTTQLLNLKVHKIQKGQGFREDKTYFSTDELPIESTEIGGKAFRPTPRKSLKKVVTSADGTTSTTTYQSYPVRIKLSTAFANEILAKNGTTTLTTQSEFVKEFAGLSVSATNDAKSLLGFAPGSDSTYVRIYYKSGGNRRTFSMYPATNYFNQVTSDRTGTQLVSLRNTGDSISSRATNNQVYLQESTGLKAKIRFPYLAKFKQKAGDIVINRAELIIPATNINTFVPSTYINFFTASKKGRIARVSGVPQMPVSPATFRNLTTGIGYRVDVTQYIQALLYNPNNAYPNNGLVLSPATLASNSASDALTVQSLKQTIINMDKTGSKIKLAIYYSGGTN